MEVESDKYLICTNKDRGEAGGRGEIGGKKVNCLKSAYGNPQGMLKK